MAFKKMYSILYNVLTGIVTFNTFLWAFLILKVLAKLGRFPIGSDGRVLKGTLMNFAVGFSALWLYGTILLILMTIITLVFSSIKINGKIRATAIFACVVTLAILYLVFFSAQGEYFLD